MSNFDGQSTGARLAVLTLLHVLGRRDLRHGDPETGEAHAGMPHAIIRFHMAYAARVGPLINVAGCTNQVGLRDRGAGHALSRANSADALSTVEPLLISDMGEIFQRYFRNRTFIFASCACHVLPWDYCSANGSSYLTFPLLHNFSTDYFVNRSFIEPITPLIHSRNSSNLSAHQHVISIPFTTNPTPNPPPTRPRS
jgi:hypothetical protein